MDNNNLKTMGTLAVVSRDIPPARRERLDTMLWHRNNAPEFFSTLYSAIDISLPNPSALEVRMQQT